MPDDPRGPVEPVARALEACPPRLVGVQLRAKESSDRDVLDWGRTLRRITRRHESPLLVNRRADLAAILDADGVHLPERHISTDAVRSIGPATWLIGVSCHDRPGLEQAREAGADFAFMSPVFEVPNKGLPLGVDGFHEAIEGVGLPTFALGGIQPSHIGAVLRAGAAGVALRRPIHSADPRSSLTPYLRELDKHARRSA